MNKKYLIFGLLGIIILYLISVAPVYNLSADKIREPNSALKNTTHNPAIDQAVFITKLNEGMIAFCGDDRVIVDNVIMDPNGRFCILKVHSFNNEAWGMVINIETNASKKNNEPWKSFEELKAQYAAELNSGNGIMVGKPTVVILDGKKLWKIPLYEYPSIGGAFWCDVYFDPVTGKSKRGNDTWKTLKEIDDEVKEMYGISVRNPLRDFYPE